MKRPLLGISVGLVLFGIVLLVSFKYRGGVIVKSEPVPVQYRAISASFGDLPFSNVRHDANVNIFLNQGQTKIGVALHQLGNIAAARRVQVDVDPSSLLAFLAGGLSTGGIAIDPPLLYFDEDDWPHLDRFGEQSSEPHRDQTLATLALLGVPSNFAFHAGRRHATVAELVESARSHFYLDDELEWSAVALACYAPTRSRWVNLWGNSFSFDDIAIRLLSMPYGSGTCGGSHTLSTLTILLQVDEQVPIWGVGTRSRVEQYLQGATALLQQNQRTDGYWTPDWNLTLADPTSEKYDKELFGVTRLMLATGHLLEWLTLRDEHLSLNPLARGRAASWCHSILLQTTNAEISRNFCPYSHAYRSVMMSKWKR